MNPETICPTFNHIHPEVQIAGQILEMSNSDFFINYSKCSEIREVNDM